MLSIDQATSIFKKKLPSYKIEKVVAYNGKYVFMAFSDAADERVYDPFYSVDAESGKFSDYSLFDDGNPNELAKIFQKTRSR